MFYQRKQDCHKKVPVTKVKTVVEMIEYYNKELEKEKPVWKSIEDAPFLYRRKEIML